MWGELPRWREWPGNKGNSRSLIFSFFPFFAFFLFHLALFVLTFLSITKEPIEIRNGKEEKEKWNHASFRFISLPLLLSGMLRSFSVSFALIKFMLSFLSFLILLHYNLIKQKNVNEPTASIFYFWHNGEWSMVGSSVSDSNLQDYPHKTTHHRHYQDKEIKDTQEPLPTRQGIHYY